VTGNRDRPQALPRWPTLGLLVSGVLALHLLLLTGGLPAFTASAASQPAEAPVAPVAVRASSVRWIVPAPAAAPEIPPIAPPSRKVAAPRSVAPVDPRPDPAPEPAAPSRPTLAEGGVQAPAEEAVEQVAQAPATAAPTPARPEPPAPVQLPASARLQYVVAGKIKGFSYSATGTLDWELDGPRYKARMEMRMPLLGSRVQTSTGSVGPEGLRPERFADKGRSERAAHFERDQQRIRFSANTPEARLLPGAQDRLSLFLQLAGLLQARPQAYGSGQVIDMQVAGTGDAEIWRFQVGEESTLTLPAGELRVRHLVRQPRKEFDSTVEMWLAPGMNHLPVRLKVTQANGDVADQQLAEKP